MPLYCDSKKGGYLVRHNKNLGKLVIAIIIFGAMIYIWHSHSAVKEAKSQIQIQPVKAKSENIGINMITTGDVSTATTQERLIENGVSFNLSNKEIVTPNSNSLIENLTFSNIGLAAVRVPKATPPADFFFITQKTKVWEIRGAIGADDLNYTKTPNTLPPEFSKLNHSTMSIKNIGNFTEFFDDRHLLTIFKAKASGAPLPDGGMIILSHSFPEGETGEYFKEGNIDGVYYPVVKTDAHGHVIESEWVVVAGVGFDKKSIISLAESDSINRYVDPPQQ
jgi:hypothetical protein